MKSHPGTLHDDCLSKLKERQYMWNKAQNIDGIVALANTVTKSSHAKYIIGVLGGITLGIMFCGVWIGRLTSSARERKAL
jgi:hypothetical protein